MPKLPPSFSLQAFPIESALSEGRTADAKRMLVEILRSGKADRVSQSIAADMISPPKRSRGRRKTFPQHWFEIGMEFHSRRGSGAAYEATLTALAAKYGFSETHIRNAIAEYDAARAAHDEATRD